MPISFFKTLSALKFTSSFSLILIYMLAIVIILYAEGIFEPCDDTISYNDVDDIVMAMDDDEGEEYEDNTCKGETHLVTNFDSTIQNIAIFVFSFACQQNVFTIVNELYNATRSRVDCVLFTAIGLALILYIVVAIEGYRTYGSEVKGDILLNYPQTGLVTMVSSWMKYCSVIHTILITVGMNIKDFIYIYIVHFSLFSKLLHSYPSLYCTMLDESIHCNNGDTFLSIAIGSQSSVFDKFDQCTKEKISTT